MARELAMPGSRMLSTVFAKTLHDQRRSLVWWALGFAGTVLMYAAFWPTIRDNASAFDVYLQKLPEVMRNLIGTVSFATPEGYLQTELFTFVAPILLLVYAISAGSRAIAGEEEAGSLDLLLSVPIRRRRVLLDKFWAMLVVTLGLVCLMWLTVIACGALFDLRPDLGNFTGASLLSFLLAVAFGSIALAVGCMTGNKGLAIGVPSGIALITFLVNMFQPSVDWLDPFRWISPFYYYSGGDPMINGLDASHALVLAAIAVVALGVALWTFERRDLEA
jgi:ABC-2 type transport system permease protein